ncbi:type 1 glutamine amidotransferase [Candidatus Magnetaquicoccus inordinatus]|uniref:type 1 glutamine amidotransferase n=1 Tax=Candidatus Magnetaquicoccus inordinatus TaxID=2496818 RepID=UPI00102C4BB4|nr:type 1 glutamine amidotransferase [Candidatus Magnetaquicoccus inordinatus]
MRLQILQHVAFEGPAHIAHWAAHTGHSVAVTHLYQEQPLPELAEVDAVVVMGGPMSVHDEREFDWLRREKEWLAKVIAAKIPVTGICLGAQLLAEILGAQVVKNRYREIGWWPIERMSMEDSPLAAWMTERLEVFHWHGETFTLPAGAIHLAGSDGCQMQAFLYEQRVLGLQFHLESTPESVALLLEHCAEELQSASPYIQDVQAIRGSAAQFAMIHPRMEQILEGMARVAAD